MCDECKVDFKSIVNELTVKQFLTIFKIAIILLLIVSGWVVLSGKTSVKDSHANFRDIFAGSSHSGNNVCSGFEDPRFSTWFVDD